jgi:hypothetical protein
MSIHEVTIAVSSILKRREQEIKFQAMCLGAEVKSETVQTKEELTEYDLDRIKRAVEEQKKMRGV